MERFSIWKRVGDWWRRRPQLPTDNNFDINADGLMVDSPVDMIRANDKEPASILMRPRKKEAQLEEGFTRLVEVLESINDNVSQQREDTTGMVRQLQGIPAVVHELSGAMKSQQELVRALSEELRSQSGRNQKLIEVIQALPEMNREQLEKLDDMSRLIRHSTDATEQSAETAQQLQRSTEDILGQSKAQTLSLRQMTELIQRNDDTLRDIIRRQSRRFIIMLVLLILALAGTAAGVIWYFLHH